MDSTASSALVSILIILTFIAGTYFAYEQGFLDPIIEKVGVFMFKAKAAAEAKKLQGQGLKAGEDFVGSQLKGNQQADDVKKGLGTIGGLKKEL